MTKSSLKKSRRFIVPEVVQTSAMDCGPASLKCLLEGHGVSVSYGRLREACQTDVDGTSIDMMEEVAKQLGLEAEQIMVPPDHLFIPEAAALPALIVVTLPNGLTHFVVAWRRHGNFVQVMDPGIGRRWQTVNAFLEELYIHTIPIPAAAWREYAGGSEFLGPLRRRLSGLGLSGRRIDKLCKEALADPHWRSIAALDASTRLVESIVRSKGLSRGGQAGHAVESFIKQTLTESLTETPTIPAVYWSVSPAPPGEDGSEQVLLRGAVLVRSLGRRVAPTKGAAKAEEGPAPLSPELLAALEEAPSRPGRKLLDMLRADGLLAPFFLLSALLVAAAGLIVEAALFRGFFDLGRMLGFADQRIGAVGALLAFLLLLLLLEFPIIKGLLNIGRHLEIRLRVAFLEKIPRLGDRYFQSRLTSDMAERSHNVRLLRLLPTIGGKLVKDCFQLILTTAGIALLDPIGAPLAALTAFIAVAVPLLAQPLIVERDLRVRSHNGALSRFYLDALLGLVAVRAHGAERAVRREHESLLVEWARASLGLQRAAVLFQAITSFSGFGLAIWLLFDHLGRSGASGGALLLVYWALNLPALGQEIALIAQQYPSYRNTTLRLLEPLGAPEEALIDADKEAHSETSAAIAQTKESGAVDEESLEEIEVAPAHAEKTGHYIVTLEGTSLQVSIAEETADEIDTELSVIAETQTYDLTSAARGVSIKFEGLTVRAAGHTILEEIDLSIPSGSHLAIVGPSGAGKSSLVGILLGWYRPAMGAVLIDGRPLDGKLLEELRKETAWVDPSVQLWNRSFIDNLFYGTTADASLPVGQVIEAAELRGVLDKLPQGLQTSLGEGGALVSGGEGQRVRLGRAMLRPDVRLVILDEPFRGLDRERRRELMTRARKIWRNATLICVTHDVSETRAFKRVLVIERGRIVEDASPLELEARPDSRYRAILEAEAAVREGLWSSDEWRRLRLDKGNLIERKEH